MFAQTECRERPFKLWDDRTREPTDQSKLAASRLLSLSLSPFDQSQVLSLQLFQNATVNEILGKLVHLGFDALLISAFLAGVKRTTAQITETSRTIRR